MLSPLHHELVKRHMGTGSEHHLTAQQRSNIPSGQFAGPDRSYPIPDINHARAALSMAHYAANPGAIRAKVHAAYPSIGSK